MVSAEYYLKAFISVMPKRYEHYNQIKTKKKQLDDAIFSSNIISDRQVKELIELLGIDTFFHKAEKRKKYTLRHMNWKLLKSIEFYVQIMSSSKLNHMINDSELVKSHNSKEDAKYIDLFYQLMDFLKFFLSGLNPLLEELSNTYKKQAEILKLLDTDKQNRMNNLQEYKELVELEESISKQVAQFFSKNKKRYLFGIKMLKDYIEYAKSKNPLEEAKRLKGIENILYIDAVLAILFGIIGFILLESIGRLSSIEYQIDIHWITAASSLLLPAAIAFLFSNYELFRLTLMSKYKKQFNGLLELIGEIVKN